MRKIHNLKQSSASSTHFLCILTYLNINEMYYTYMYSIQTNWKTILILFKFGEKLETFVCCQSKLELTYSKNINFLIPLESENNLENLG